MNKVFLTGNLTRDPELTETASGVNVCRFGLAVNRAYSNADGEHQTDFFRVTAWRGVGECVAKYCKKGSRVLVTGSIELRSYEDNEGIKRNTVEIVAQDVEFLFSKSQSGYTEKSDDDDGDIPF